MRWGGVSLLLALAVIAAACSDSKTTPNSDAGTTNQPPTPEAGAGVESGSPSGCTPQQPGSPHLATPPVLYGRRRNPIPENPDTTAKGALLFTQECIRCHGPNGKGDGPDGASLDPKPADFTARTHFDDYLFWRVSEGGLGDPTCSAMPAFKSKFSEEDRWVLVRHIQSFAKPDGG
jgi:mono/diheme cytochrome c family protein